MIQMKIFAGLDFLKKTDTIQEGSLPQAIHNILSEINTDRNNIPDAYVTLDFISKATSGVLKAIEEYTIEHIIASGDDESMGLQLVVKTVKVPDYSMDKEWVDMKNKIRLYEDALKKREQIIFDQANDPSSGKIIKFTPVSSIALKHIGK